MPLDHLHHFSWENLHLTLLLGKIASGEGFGARLSWETTFNGPTLKIPENHVKMSNWDAYRPFASFQPGKFAFDAAFGKNR